MVIFKDPHIENSKNFKKMIVPASHWLCVNVLLNNIIFCNEFLSRQLVTYWDGLLARMQAVTLLVLSRPGVEQLRWLNTLRYHYASPPQFRVWWTHGIRWTILIAHLSWVIVASFWAISCPVETHNIKVALQERQNNYLLNSNRWQAVIVFCAICSGLFASASVVSQHSGDPAACVFCWGEWP